MQHEHTALPPEALPLHPIRPMFTSILANPRSLESDVTPSVLLPPLGLPTQGATGWALKGSLSAQLLSPTSPFPI